MNRVSKVAARVAGALFVGVSLGFVGLSQVASGADPKPVDFNKDVKPILNNSCVKCHRQDQRNPRGPAGGLRLDDKASALKGGKSGPAIVPGKADESLLVKLLAGPTKVGDHDLSGMPKPQRGKEFAPLAKEKVDVLKQWIDQGANWPG